MKKIIKKLIPIPVLQVYRSSIEPIKKSKFKNKDLANTFSEIYATNHWSSDESISGTGSDFKQTKTLINELSTLIKELNIKSVLDIPCGDMNWMPKVNLENVNYIGADIVPDLIQRNKSKFSDKSNFTFQVLDLTKDKLPKVDLVICRDCLVHLSYESIFKAFQNLKKSGSKYLLTTTYDRHNLNYDINSGDWRTLNLEKKPFNFSAPLNKIDEKCSEGAGEFSDKMLSLWSIENLPNMVSI